MPFHFEGGYTQVEWPVAALAANTATVVHAGEPAGQLYILINNDVTDLHYSTTGAASLTSPKVGPGQTWESEGQITNALSLFSATGGHIFKLVVRSS